MSGASRIRPQRRLMPALFYVRLIAFTAGALLFLFLVALIVGHRRPRRFERVLFFLILSLFFFYSGALLAANAAIHYVIPPVSTATLAMGLALCGLGFLPGLLVHAEVEYAGVARAVRIGAWQKTLVTTFYLPTVFFLARIAPQILARPGLDVLWAGGFPAAFYGIWLSLALAAGAWFEVRASDASDDPSSRRLHILLGAIFGILAALVFYTYGLGALHTSSALENLGTLVIVAGFDSGSGAGLLRAALQLSADRHATQFGLCRVRSVPGDDVSRACAEDEWVAGTGCSSRSDRGDSAVCVGVPFRAAGEGDWANPLSRIPTADGARAAAAR